MELWATNNMIPEIIPQNINATTAHPVEFNAFSEAMSPESTACLILLKRLKTKIVGIANTAIKIISKMKIPNVNAPTPGDIVLVRPPITVTIIIPMTKYRHNPINVNSENIHPTSRRVLMLGNFSAFAAFDLFPALLLCGWAPQLGQNTAC